MLVTTTARGLRFFRGKSSKKRGAISEREGSLTFQLIDGFSETLRETEIACNILLFIMIFQSKSVDVTKIIILNEEHRLISISENLDDESTQR